MTHTGDKLNLGCGIFKKPGFLNVDGNPGCEPDLVCDLDQFPYPFAENQFVHVEADHVLEHLNHPFTAMQELHRILKPGGSLIVRVPHFSRGMAHADHKRGFDTSFSSYFQPEFHAGYVGAHFRTDGTKLLWFSQPYLKRVTLSPVEYHLLLLFGRSVEIFANLSPRICNRLWCFWVGGFEEIEFRFTCIK